MINYPAVDTKISGYRALIWYPSSNTGDFVLPGWHDTYESALQRAQRVSYALVTAGESGCVPVVGYSGVRPKWMQRHRQVD